MERCYGRRRHKLELDGEPLIVMEESTRGLCPEMRLVPNKEIFIILGFVSCAVNVTGNNAGFIYILFKRVELNFLRKL